MLDLFSGCGGLTKGFDLAKGFEPLAGIDDNRDAITTYAKHFHGLDRDPSRAQTHSIETPPKKTLKRLKVSPDDIHVVVGGPPCPAFTHIGRAKLAHVAKNPNAYLTDPRAALWKDYVKWVEYTTPIALVMENVPGILKWDNGSLIRDLRKKLERLGYKCDHKILNSADYGVAQVRKRFFLIAVHTVVGLETIPFPKPSVKKDKHKTVETALDDLPKIKAHTSRHKKAIQAHKAKQKDAADDPGLQHQTHTRFVTPRDHRIFKKMKAGDDYPRALKIAAKAFQKANDEYLTQKTLRKGRPKKEDYVPPYDENKYKDKWWKLRPDLPSKTVMAHLAKDGYSHIHHKQPRMLSVREAARLQSFTDNFKFSGPMTSAFRQIGNAVPPLMAKALAETLKKVLRRRKSG